MSPTRADRCALALDPLPAAAPDADASDVETGDAAASDAAVIERAVSRPVEFAVIFDRHFATLFPAPLTSAAAPARPSPSRPTAYGQS